LCDVDRVSVEAWLNVKEQGGLGWWSRIDLKGVLSAVFTAVKTWKLWEGDNPSQRRAMLDRLMGVECGKPQ
jgi:hypothetical protein